MTEFIAEYSRILKAVGASEAEYESADTAVRRVDYGGLDCQ